MSDNRYCQITHYRDPRMKLKEGAVPWWEAPDSGLQGVRCPTCDRGVTVAIGELPKPCVVCWRSPTP